MTSIFYDNQSFKETLYVQMHEYNRSAFITATFAAELIFKKTLQAKQYRPVAKQFLDVDYLIISTDPHFCSADTRLTHPCTIPKFASRFIFIHFCHCLHTPNTPQKTEQQKNLNFFCITIHTQSALQIQKMCKVYCDLDHDSNFGKF